MNKTKRDQWENENSRAIHGRSLPGKGGPLREDEPLNIGAVFYALMEIRKGTCREIVAPSSGQILSRDQVFDSSNYIEVNRPSEDAVRIITRALQAGSYGEGLIKKALELKPRAKGAILARHIARKLTRPKGGWPKTDEELEQWNSDTVEWIKPSKGEVERELENRYPKIYAEIPKKDGSGGKLLRSEFWRDAGLKDEIDQSRGYK